MKTFCRNFKIYRKKNICFLKEKKILHFHSSRLILELQVCNPTTTATANFISPKVWSVPAQIKNTFRKNFFVSPANVNSRKVPTVKRRNFWQACLDSFPQNSKNLQKFLFRHEKCSSQKAAGTLICSFVNLLMFVCHRIIIFGRIPVWSRIIIFSIKSFSVKLISWTCSIQF